MVLGALKSVNEGLVLGLDVVWEHLDCEVFHFVLSVVVLILTFDHDVKLLKPKLIKMFLHSLLIIVLLELSELFCAHSHQRGSLITRKVNVN